MTLNAQVTRSIMLWLGLGALLFTPHAACAWVTQALAGDEAPPTLCVSREGLSSFYLQERVELQQRHGSWTLYWRADRPAGFKPEEQVALLTLEESQALLGRLAAQLSAPPLARVRRALSYGAGCPTAPSSPERGAWGVQTTISVYLSAQDQPPPSLLRGLSPAELRGRQGRGLWLQWPLGDVEAALEPSGERAYALIEALLARHIRRPHPRDQLLTPQERGQLLVKTDRPARLEIDGVDYGEPGLNPIPTSPGLHTLTLYPLSPPLGPFRYRQVEVEQGKLTRLKLTLE